MSNKRKRDSAPLLTVAAGRHASCLLVQAGNAWSHCCPEAWELAASSLRCLLAFFAEAAASAGSSARERLRASASTSIAASSAGSGASGASVPDGSGVGEPVC
eukprot:277212-Amphidinium_carterae.1